MEIDKKNIYTFIYEHIWIKFFNESLYIWNMLNVNYTENDAWIELNNDGTMVN